MYHTRAHIVVVRCAGVIHRAVAHHIQHVTELYIYTDGVDMF